MKTIPIAKPGAGPQPTPDAGVAAAKAARERAVKILETPPGSKSNPIPVNANAIAPEDMTAVKPQVLQSNTTVEYKAETAAETAQAAPEAPKPSNEPSKEPSNSQLAILARKERAMRAQLQQQKQAADAERQALQQEKAQLEQRVKELETGYIPKSSLKQEALEAIRRGELSYDEVTHEVMNPTDPRITSTIRNLESQVKDLQARLDRSAKASEDAQTAQYQAAVKQIETDVRALVKSDPSFEAIKFTRSERDVVDLIERTYKEDGYVMSVEEAAQEVENYLVEEASKLAKLEKIKKKVSPQPEQAKNAAQPEGQKADTNQNKQPQQMKTLTNTVSSSRKLSGRDRAILAFKGELKS